MYRYILHTFLSRVSSTLLNFFIVLVIARHAGPAIKGEVTLLITVSWFFIFFSNILGGQALVYLIPRNKIELLVVPAYLWSLVVSVMGFSLLKAIDIIQVNHITSITVLSLLYSFVTIHQTILLAKKQIVNTNLLQIMTLLIQATGIVFCFYTLHIDDAFAYIYSSIAAYSFTALLSFFLISRLVKFTSFKKDFTRRELFTSFRYGFLYQITELFQLLNLRYYYFQMSRMEGNQYLGVYSIGIAVLETVWLIPRSISTVHYVSTSNTGKMKEEAFRTVQLLKLSFVLSAVAVLVIALIPPSVYIFVFGEGFRYTRHGMRFLFPGILIYNAVIVISSFYQGIGRYTPMILSYFIGFITLAVAGYFLLPPYVITGAGLAATISFGVASLVILIFFIADNHIQFSKLIVSINDVRLFLKKLSLWSNGKERTKTNSSV